MKSPTLVPIGGLDEFTWSWLAALIGTLAVAAAAYVASHLGPLGPGFDFPLSSDPALWANFTA
jgi:hypothetical protein